jgi:hypothetical protein
LFTNDYIMRQIEMLVWGIALIMGLKKENKQEEAAEALTGTLRKFFGLSDEAVEELPWESLMSVAGLGGAPDPERCALLGQLVKEKADLKRMKGGDAGGLYIKALNMIATAMRQEDRLATALNKQYVDEIVEATAGMELPEESRLLLFAYYELAGLYGKAEDMLYDLLKSTGDRSDIVESGREFYQRLLRLDDKTLREGNLPRNEVMEGYNKLKI